MSGVHHMSGDPVRTWLGQMQMRGFGSEAFDAELADARAGGHLNEPRPYILDALRNVPMKKPGQQPTILMIKCHLAKTVGEISLQRLVHYMGSFPERFVLTGVGAMATVREVGGADNADAVAAATAARDAERGAAREAKGASSRIHVWTGGVGPGMGMWTWGNKKIDDREGERRDRNPAKLPWRPAVPASTREERDDNRRILHLLEKREDCRKRNDWIGADRLLDELRSVYKVHLDDRERTWAFPRDPRKRREHGAPPPPSSGEPQGHRRDRSRSRSRSSRRDDRRTRDERRAGGGDDRCASDPRWDSERWRVSGRNRPGGDDRLDSDARRGSDHDRRGSEPYRRGSNHDWRDDGWGSDDRRAGGGDAWPSRVLHPDSFRESCTPTIGGTAALERVSTEQLEAELRRRGGRAS